MKLITLYLNLHESPCLSVQSKLFGLTSVIVDYLWRIILWKPWHDNVEDHHLWTLAAEEEEVIWTKSKRTAEFFRETFPHTFNICTKYNAYMTPGLVFCETTKWVNESTSWSSWGKFILLTNWLWFQQKTLFRGDFKPPVSVMMGGWSCSDDGRYLLRGNLFKSLSSLVKLWGFFAAKFWSFLGGKNCSIQEIDF